MTWRRPNIERTNEKTATTTTSIKSVSLCCCCFSFSFACLFFHVETERMHTHTCSLTHVCLRKSKGTHDTTCPCPYGFLKSLAISFVCAYACMALTLNEKQHAQPTFVNRFMNLHQKISFVSFVRYFWISEIILSNRNGVQLPHVCLFRRAC